MDDARALERGTAGPRDYRRAAEIYGRLCRDGAGDLAACHALLRAIYEARGVAFDQATAGKLGLAMCERGEHFGCVAAIFFRDQLTMSETLLAAVGARVEAAEEACRAGDPAACEAALFVNGVGAAGTSAGNAGRHHAFAVVACSIGVVDGCDWVFTADKHSGAPGDGHQHALDVLTAACDAGEYMACDVLGRPLDPALLCAAHAYRACSELGCRGDDAAARLALDHGVLPRCE